MTARKTFFLQDNDIDSHVFELVDHSKVYVFTMFLIDCNFIKYEFLIKSFFKVINLGLKQI